MGRRPHCVLSLLWLLLEVLLPAPLLMLLLLLLLLLTFNYGIAVDGVEVVVYGVEVAVHCVEVTVAVSVGIDHVAVVDVVVEGSEVGAVDGIEVGGRSSDRAVMVLNKDRHIHGVRIG